MMIWIDLNLNSEHKALLTTCPGTCGACAEGSGVPPAPPALPTALLLLPSAARVPKGLLHTQLRLPGLGKLPHFQNQRTSGRSVASTVKP